MTGPTLASVLIEAGSTSGYTLPVPPEQPGLTLDTVMLRALCTAGTGVMALCTLSIPGDIEVVLTACDTGSPL